MLERMVEAQRTLCGVLTRIGELQESLGHKSQAKSTRGSVDLLKDYRFRVGILGGMKRGKSTLINALLDRKDDLLAPVSAVPATGVISEFEGGGPGSETSAQVVLRNNPDSAKPIAIGAIRDYATEENNKKNHRGVERIRVRGDFPLLGDATVLVDTPGSGSIFTDHTAAAIEALSLCDAYVLLVSATIPIDRSEQEFLQRIGERERRQFIVALTKCDELMPKDRSAVLARIGEECARVGLQPERIIELSARRALVAAGTGDAQAARTASGVTELVGEIERVISSQSIRLEAQRSRLAEAVAHADDYLRRELEATRRDLAIADETVDQIVKRREELKERFESAETEFKATRQRFRTGWSGLMRRFASGVQSSAHRLEAPLETWLDRQSGITGTFRASSGLHGQVSRQLSSAIAGDFQSLQEGAERLLEKLHAESDSVRDIALPRARLDGAPLASGAVPTVVVGSLLGAGGTVLAQLASVQAAYAAFGTATAVANSSGAAFSFWAWLSGYGAAAEATKAAALASSTLVSTAISAVVVSGGAIAAGFAATKITQVIVKGRTRSQIGPLIEQAIDQVLDRMVGEDRQSGLLGLECDKVIRECESRFEEVKAEHIARLEKLEHDVRAKDPDLAPRLQLRLAHIERLYAELADARSRIGTN